ncbi:YqcI/YcgG family protein [Streptomyces sp. NPDC032940]|uniref:YqcI/YcgG family protein n=1 Tax=Streptomyces sp. NPDC032940 TaxID=3155366 RepID=UPI0033D3797A
MLYSLEQLRGVEASAPDGIFELAHTFGAIVDDPEFPCIFSSAPFLRHEIFFGLAEDEAPECVVPLLKELCDRFADTPDAVGVIFVPQSPDATLEDDFELARAIVRSVGEQNELDGNADGFPEPGEADWRLRLNRIELFVNFSSPRHQKRRSRNVGPCFTLVVQARSSFDKPAFRSAKGRGEIRQRLAVYDSVTPHPSLGDHRDPDDHDELHFFLGDGHQPMDVTGAGGSRTRP